MKIKDILLITSNNVDKGQVRKLSIKIKEYQISELYTVEKMFKEFVKKHDSNFILSVEQQRIPEILNKVSLMKLTIYILNQYYFALYFRTI